VSSKMLTSAPDSAFNCECRPEWVKKGKGGRPGAPVCAMRAKDAAASSCACVFAGSIISFGLSFLFFFLLNVYKIFFFLDRSAVVVAPIKFLLVATI